MSFEISLWVTIGITLMVLELFIPGLVSVFLGIAAIAVGAMIYLGWISGIIQSLGVWMGLSVFLMMTVRQVAARFWLSDAEYKYTEEDDDAVGQVVEISQTVNNSGTEGRIRFRGTDWPARSLNETLKKGSYAVIKYRDNISWIVEKPGKTGKPDQQPPKINRLFRMRFKFRFTEKPHNPSNKEN